MSDHIDAMVKAVLTERYGNTFNFDMANAGMQSYRAVAEAAYDKGRGDHSREKTPILIEDVTKMARREFAREALLIDLYDGEITYKRDAERLGRLLAHLRELKKQAGEAD
jgi:hypothetical protein